MNPMFHILTSKHACMYFIIVDVYYIILLYQLSDFSHVFCLIVQSKIKRCCMSLLNIAKKLLSYK